jgi:hypothetical protein
MVVMVDATSSPNGRFQPGSGVDALFEVVVVQEPEVTVGHHLMRLAFRTPRGHPRGNKLGMRRTVIHIDER